MTAPADAPADAPEPARGRLRLDGDSMAVLRRHAVAVGAAAVAAGAALAWRFGASPLLPAYLVFVALGCALSVIDLALHRLPDALTLPAYPLFALLLAYPSVQDPGVALRALLAAVAALVFYLAAALLPDGPGLGDVKAAGPIGALLGWTGWYAVVAGTFLAFVLTALAGTVQILARRAPGRTRLPFGPSLYGGAVLALLLFGR
ncbi:prepilin peptidase [Streptomyces kaniharaensis]|uniref:Prepilin peptidase n=1 Tax=Streptomyces kaniharaensis TaxID=212423 RepID=A0A6N7L1V0_9ACTN|nr:A24 family peptidase [Streptomyces kaniharaensis]MQS16478.1 prepilin peptidase [Streptomyces kaniharaensis]